MKHVPTKPGKPPTAKEPFASFAPLRFLIFTPSPPFAPFPMQHQRHFHLAISALEGEYHIDVWGKPTVPAPAANSGAPGAPSDYATCTTTNEQSDPQAPAELIEWYQKRELKLRFLDQVHGDALIRTNGGDSLYWGQADAACNHEPHHAIAIRTADCIPLLFFDTSQILFGGIHAGWRGLQNGIIEKTLRSLFSPQGNPPPGEQQNSKPDTPEPQKAEPQNSKAPSLKSQSPELKNPEKLFLFSGPFISADQYETGPEVYGCFESSCSFESSQPGKKFLNMKKILQSQIENATPGQSTLMQMEACTKKDHRFFSHRGGDTERNFSVISFLKKRDSKKK